MRNLDQRVHAALSGATRIKQKQRKQRLLALASGTVTLSLCLIILMAYFLPPTMTNVLNQTTTTAFSASIFANSATLSYIIIGLISFALGICVTLLCILLHKKYKEEV